MGNFGLQTLSLRSPGPFPISAEWGLVPGGIGLTVTWSELLVNTLQFQLDGRNWVAAIEGQPWRGGLGGAQDYVTKMFFRLGGMKTGDNVCDYVPLRPDIFSRATGEPAELFRDFPVSVD